MGHPIRHRTLPFLVLLLALQLTGLSCLGDWHDETFSLHSADHHHALSAQPDHATPANDTCPCHLAFVSMLGGTFSVENPAALFNASPPAACPCAALTVPFHPPLGS